MGCNEKKEALLALFSLLVYIDITHDRLPNMTEVEKVDPHVASEMDSRGYAELSPDFLLSLVKQGHILAFSDQGFDLFPNEHCERFLENV